MMNQLNSYLDNFDPIEFIANDPIQFPRRFVYRVDIEISAFLTSCLSFGNRKQIIAKCEWLHEQMGESPYDFVLALEWKKWEHNHEKFYRFYSYHDLFEVFLRLHQIYEGFGLDFWVRDVESLRILFPGCKMVPQSNNSACKRLNMFLRWMCRKDEVDLGIWNCVPTSKLLIPLDVHVGNVARKFGLLTRKQNDMKAVIELTKNLSTFNPACQNPK